MRVKAWFFTLFTQSSASLCSFSHMNAAKKPFLRHTFSPSCVECYKCGRGGIPHATLFRSNPICLKGCKSRPPLLPWTEWRIGFFFSIGQKRWILQRAVPPSLHPHYHHFYCRQRDSAVKITQVQLAHKTNVSFVCSLRVNTMIVESEACNVKQ